MKYLAVVTLSAPLPEGVQLTRLTYKSDLLKPAAGIAANLKWSSMW